METKATTEHLLQVVESESDIVREMDEVRSVSAAKNGSCGCDCGSTFASEFMSYGDLKTYHNASTHVPNIRTMLLWSRSASRADSRSKASIIDADEPWQEASKLERSATR